MLVSTKLSEPLLAILYEKIMDNDEVMQVQLLNLLKVLLLNTRTAHKSFEEDAIRIFGSQILQDCLNCGLQISYVFVRNHFFSFIESCLPIFKDVLTTDQNLNIATKFVLTTSDFLVRRVKQYSAVMKSKLVNDKGKISQLYIDKNKYSLVNKNYLEHLKELKSFDESDMYTIIKGLHDFLFFFMNIKPVGSFSECNMKEFKKKLIQKSGGVGSFISGLFSTKSFDESGKHTENLITTELFGIIEDVLASLINCWQNDSDIFMKKDLCLSDNGMFGFSAQELDEELDNFSSKTKNYADFQVKTNLKDLISRICLNLYLSNPYGFFNKLVSLWLKPENRFMTEESQSKLTLIEILLSMNIHIGLIIHSLGKNVNFEIVKASTKSNIKNKEGYYLYNCKYSTCTYEAKILQFIFSILCYYTGNASNSAEIWIELLEILEEFSESKSPYTHLWIFEIINLSVLKYPLKDIDAEKTIKSQVSALINKELYYLVDIALSNKFYYTFSENVSLVFPINPSIFEATAVHVYSKNISKPNYSLYENHTNKLKVTTSTTEPYFDFVFDIGSSHSTLSTTDIEEYIRNAAFFTLKNVFYNIMKSIYTTEKKDKVIAHIQSIVGALLTILTDNKSYLIHTELATEFLHNIMTKASEITSTNCRDKILAYFLETDFFSTNRYCFRLWIDIIRVFATYNHDIVVDLLVRMSSMGASFFGRADDKPKIRALRRISFMIYCSEKDAFSSNLSLILEKVKDVITNEDKNPLLEAEIYLMIRVMFLKFSHENLVEMLRHLWPIIFSGLVAILTNQKKIQIHELSLSTLKLVELLSLANSEEFSLYQWIFFYDSHFLTSNRPIESARTRSRRQN